MWSFCDQNIWREDQMFLQFGKDLGRKSKVTDFTGEEDVTRVLFS